MRDRGSAADAWARPREVAFGNAYQRQVQRAIDSKNAKCDGYRLALPGAPIWLVVYGGTEFANGTPSGLVRRGEYHSAFDRTFYVDAMDGAAFELASVPV